MTHNDSYLAEVFAEPPLTAFKRQKKNKRHSNKSLSTRTQETIWTQKKKVMNKCGKDCTTCPLIRSGNKVKLTNNKHWNINKNANCNSFNVIYLLECDKDKCRKRYIGETGCVFRFRLANTKAIFLTRSKASQQGLISTCQAIAWLIWKQQYWNK